MVYNLTYRRPSPADSSESLTEDEKKKSLSDSTDSEDSIMSNGIPDDLSFERVLSGGICPPCTLRDFMNYLKYIEHAAENLQFFLWYRDYCQRFEKLPDSEKKLSPEWTKQQLQNDATIHTKITPGVAAIFKGTDFEKASQVQVFESVNPFSTPPLLPDDLKKETASLDSADFSDLSMVKTNHTQRAKAAFVSAGLKWAPLSVQPYRGEITRIISIYIAEGGTRELNLSSKERAALLHALQNTTHPSAFAEVVVTVEWSLRCQAHPNFIRWTICNGNPARVAFARGLGVAGILAGFVAAIVITLSNAPRAWRALSLIGFLIGISTLIAAWKGMCVVLHGMHHRHLRPWELFTSDTENGGFDMQTESLESLATQESSNSFEDEPWVVKYDRRNIIRKIFDREVWVQEPALRQLQDTIFLQAIIGAVVSSGVIVGVFCALPHGGFF